MSDESQHPSSNDPEISGDGSSERIDRVSATDRTFSSEAGETSYTLHISEKHPSSSTPQPDDVIDEDMEELRRILFGDSINLEDDIQQRIDRVAHLKEDGQIEEISNALPDAFMLHNKESSTRLANALTPTVEKTLTLSVQRNPKPIVDAIFPIIGPSIRRSIREALKSMMDSVNSVLENSFSPKSIQWRIEAMSSGRSFSEVVLAHTLNYRVEQLFLIDRDTGVLIHHLYADAVAVKDGDIVSGMLSAVQSFVRNSLDVEQNAMLESLEIDGLEVLIEAGPKAILAAVIRGIPGQEVKKVLQELIEALHLQYGYLLDAYDGDTSLCEPILPLLQTGMITRYKQKQSSRPVGSWVLTGVLIALFFVWLALSLINQQRWKSYLTILQQEPGIVVTESRRSWGTWYIEGLRDPLAADPTDFLQTVALSEDKVVASWEHYLAMDSAIVIQRIRRQLDVPTEVRMTLDNGVLYLSGQADANWAREARERSPFLIGLSGYDDSQLEYASDRLIASIEASTIIFPQGSTAIDADQARALQAVAQSIETLVQQIPGLQEILISGYVSTEGSETTNQLLSQQRADAVREALVAHGINRSLLDTQGMGVPRIPGVELTEEDRIANRSVTFSVRTP